MRTALSQICRKSLITARKASFLAYEIMMPFPCLSTNWHVYPMTLNWYVYEVITYTLQYKLVIATHLEHVEMTG